MTPTNHTHHRDNDRRASREVLLSLERRLAGIDTKIDYLIAREPSPWERLDWYARDYRPRGEDEGFLKDDYL